MSENLQSQHNLERFEIVAGESSDIWGLQLSADTSEMVVWWITEKNLARMHNRIHWTLNRDDEWLKKKGGSL